MPIDVPGFAIELAERIGVDLIDQRAHGLAVLSVVIHEDARYHPGQVGRRAQHLDHPGRFFTLPVRSDDHVETRF
ncbi:hypothetical protein D3C73_1266960 [compost metagenome]